MANPSTQSRDTVPEPPSAGAKEPIFFAVMGTTGSGKSTFIQKASGREDVVIGHGLTSCTTEPYLYDFTSNGRCIALLDTPGFDDTYKTDAEVLKSVADFLAATYKKKIKLSGIVYLQRITDPRMTHGGRANLAMFRALCGDDPLRKVVLATTFWGEAMNIERAMEKEQELKATPDYWGDMLAKKATMTRFHDTQESALNILRDLMTNEEKLSLTIQREMVDENKDLAETTAGETLEMQLSVLAEKYAKDLERHKEEMQAALAAHDVELQEIKQEQTQRTEDLLHHMQNQRESLNARRRDELRERDMQFDTRLRKIMKEHETEAIQQLKEIDQADAESNESDVQRKQLLTEQRQKAIIKRAKILEILGAVGTTATAAGISVINPLAIPVAFGGLVQLLNVCFSRRDAKKLEGNDSTGIINNVTGA